jgi:CysZ protein
MGFWSDYGKGVSTHIRAFEFIGKHNLWTYFLYPIALLVILLFFGFWGASGIARQLADFLTAYIPEDVDTGTAWLDSFMHGLLWVVRVAFGFILWIFIFLVVMKVIRYAVLILCSPMMALLSERVDEIVTGNKYPFNASQFVKDVLRGILISLRNLFLELLITLGLTLIGWIPVIGWITIPFLWCISWYFLGFSMMDYSYERRRMSISQGIRFTRRRKGIAIGNGMIFSFLLSAPFLGLIVAPVLSVVAGTLATLEALKENP